MLSLPLKCLVGVQVGGRRRWITHRRLQLDGGFVGVVPPCPPQGVREATTFLPGVLGGLSPRAYCES